MTDTDPLGLADLGDLFGEDTYDDVLFGDCEHDIDGD